MNDLLTARDVQDLLRVDRVTVYRMIKDGRLPAFKVGGQWRFPRLEIERWLQAQRGNLVVAESPGVPADIPSASDVLPLPCVQAIQSVYAEALDVAAVTVDLDGIPLTEVSNSCAFCDLILSTEEGRRRCERSWQAAPDAEALPALRPCHAGLLCANAPVSVGAHQVASVAGCQFAARGSEDAWRVNLPALAANLGLDEAELQIAAAGIRSLPENHLSRVPRLLRQVADTFGEIGQERANFVDRLQRIAQMTEV